MSIDEAMRFLRNNNVFLVHSDHGPDLWTCGRPMPQSLRRAIYKHRQELLRLMSEGDKRTCASPMLHKSYTRNGVCQACRELEEVRHGKSA